MDHVKVFLRTPLFSPTLDKNSPSILIGRVREQVPGGLVLDVEEFRTANDAPVSGRRAPALFVPLSKIDYAELREEG